MGKPSIAGILGLVICLILASKTFAYVFVDDFSTDPRTQPAWTEDSPSWSWTPGEFTGTSTTSPDDIAFFVHTQFYIGSPFFTGEPPVETQRIRVVTDLEISEVPASGNTAGLLWGHKYSDGSRTGMAVFFGQAPGFPGIGVLGIQEISYDPETGSGQGPVLGSVPILSGFSFDETYTLTMDIIDDSVSAYLDTSGNTNLASLTDIDVSSVYDANIPSRGGIYASDSATFFSFEVDATPTPIAPSLTLLISGIMMLLIKRRLSRQ